MIRDKRTIEPQKKVRGSRSTSQTEQSGTAIEVKAETLTAPAPFPPGLSTAQDPKQAVEL